MMKKYPKPISCDERGQLVIPKEIRRDIGIDEGTGLFLYQLHEEGILLKKIEPEPLTANDKVLDEIQEKADKIGIKKQNIKQTIEQYEKKTEGNLELI